MSRARARRAVRRTRNSSTNSRSVSRNRVNDNHDDTDSGHTTDNEADEESASPRKQTSSGVNQAAGLLMSLSAQNSFTDDKVIIVYFLFKFYQK